MKKLLILFAFVALASSVFAEATISDWQLGASSIALNYVADESISDVPPAGFDFDAGLTSNTIYKMCFLSNNVSGWIYNRNNAFSIVVTGFDDIPADRMYVWLYGGDSAFERYRLSYSGAGTYSIGPGDVIDSHDFNVNDSIDTFEIWFIHENANYACYTTDTTAGSMRVIVEKPDTVVPEPASAAYALVGFAPLFGLKRRIKK